MSDSTIYLIRRCKGCGIKFRAYRGQQKNCRACGTSTARASRAAEEQKKSAELQEALIAQSARHAADLRRRFSEPRPWEAAGGTHV